MKKALIMVLILVLASGYAAAQLKGGQIGINPTPSKVRLMPQVDVLGGDQSIADKFDTQATFPDLLANNGDSGCYQGCNLKYTFTNTQKYPLDRNDIHLKEYDLAAQDLDNLKNVQVTDYLSGTTETYTDQYIQPGDSIDRDITADKIHNIDMDVVPSLVLTATKYPAIQQLGAIRVDLDQTLMAIWRKGPIGVQPDIVVHLPLNETTGATAYDTSGYARNGIYIGSPTLNQAGVFDSSVKFNGNNIITFNDAATSGMWGSIQTNNKYYISFWFKPSMALADLPANEVLVGRYGTGGTFFYILGLGATKHFYYKQTDTSDTNKCEVGDGSLDSAWAKNIWNHIVFGYNGTNCVLYVNGTLLSTVKVATTINATIKWNTTIGGQYDGSAITGPFNGTIDEIFLSNDTNAADTSVGYSNMALLQYQAALTEESIGTPASNNTVFPFGSTVDLNTTIGANFDLKNITVVNAGDGTSDILNKGTNGTAGHSLLYTLNTTNYVCRSQYTLTPGTYNYGIWAANNGSAIQSNSANYTWTFTIDTTTTTTSITGTTTSTTTTTTSTTLATSGGISNWDPNNYLTQINQGIANLADYFNRDTDTCQLVADNSSDFSHIFINQRSYVTDYTWDEYLPAGHYYWKVRCKRGERWSYWSNVKEFDYTGGSIYFDWTIVT